MKTKLAVIGTGNVGILHGNAASTLENVELVAGIDVIPGSLKKFTDQFGVPGFASVTEMLKHVKPDVVTIGTPQHYRLDPVRTSLENGIHVLAEKPLAANSLEGRQMVQKADQCGLVLGIVSQRAFYPSLQRLKRLFDSGDFEVLSGTGQGFGHRDEAYYQGASGFRGKRGDGAMLNQYAHYMANLVFLLGAFESVSAEMANLNHP
jgi:UDP-N-acetyl-2-amino-2-deoxyglucuronate dehydrogenase